MTEGDRLCRKTAQCILVSLAFCLVNIQHRFHRIQLRRSNVANFCTNVRNLNLLSMKGPPEEQQRPGVNDMKYKVIR